MEVVPPLCLSDIEVAHRLGKEPKHGPVQMPSAPQDDEAEMQQPMAAAQSMPPVKPRSIIVKFASRRTKALVMNNRKNLKSNPFQYQNGATVPIYTSEDLTKRRAYPVFQARVLKRSRAILDTWVFEGRILVKDNHRPISQNNTMQYICKFQLS